MGDDFRTTVAHILYGDGDDVPWPRALELADLVIWGTGLCEEKQTIDKLCDDGCVIVLRRWVTDWKADA